MNGEAESGRTENFLLFKGMEQSMIECSFKKCCKKYKKGKRCKNCPEKKK